jgi:hypothetical protein
VAKLNAQDTFLTTSWFVIGKEYKFVSFRPDKKLCHTKTQLIIKGKAFTNVIRSPIKQVRLRHNKQSGGRDKTLYRHCLPRRNFYITKTNFFIGFEFYIHS